MRINHNTRKVTSYVYMVFLCVFIISCIDSDYQLTLSDGMAAHPASRHYVVGDVTYSKVLNSVVGQWWVDSTNNEYVIIDKDYIAYHIKSDSILEVVQWHITIKDGASEFIADAKFPVIGKFYIDADKIYVNSTRQILSLKIQNKK